MTYEIRTAEHADAQKLEDLIALSESEELRPLARESIACMFSGDYYRPTFMIAIEGDNIIGCIVYSEEMFTIDFWGISWVNVHPEKRNQGVGLALVETCLAEISKKADKTVTAILVTVPGQSRLYEYAGFKKCGEDHEGGWIMTKILKV